MLNSIFTNFASETAEPASGISALGFDLKAFVIQLITFLLVFYILKRFVFGRIVDMLDKRREVIEQGVQLTTEMVAQRDKLEAEVEKTIKNARKEADAIIVKTQVQATEIIKEAEEAAKKKANSIISDARGKIEDETLSARRKLEKEVLELVVEATEIVVSEKIDAKKDASLLSNALKGKA